MWTAMAAAATAGRVFFVFTLIHLARLRSPSAPHSLLRPNNVIRGSDAPFTTRKSISVRANGSGFQPRNRPHRDRNGSAHAGPGDLSPTQQVYDAGYAFS